MEALRRSLDLYSAHYENIILLGDFNVNIYDLGIECFCDLWKFRSLIKDLTCFEHPENTPCIDLVLVSKPYSFQNSRDWPLRLS